MFLYSSPVSAHMEQVMEVCIVRTHVGSSSSCSPSVVVTLVVHSWKTVPVEIEMGKPRHLPCHAFCWGTLSDCSEFVLTSLTGQCSLHCPDVMTAAVVYVVLGRKKSGETPASVVSSCSSVTGTNLLFSCEEFLLLSNIVQFEKSHLFVSHHQLTT